MPLLDKTRIALLGCGDIGSRLATRLLIEGAEVHGFRRNIAKLPNGVIAHPFDVHDESSLHALNTIAFDYLVITLSPDEMTDSAYLATYVEGLRHILSQLNTDRLRKLFWVSSTSVYGQSDGSIINEQSPTQATRFSGKRQLEAEQLLSVLTDKACIVRFAGIYREGKHRLIDQLIAGQLSNNIEHDYYTNRIHITDCVGILFHLIQQVHNNVDIHPVYIGCDNSPVLYSELIDWLSQRLTLPLCEDGATATARVGSKRCDNTQILHSGYVFTYPTYQAGFSSIIENYSIITK